MALAKLILPVGLSIGFVISSYLTYYILQLKSQISLLEKQLNISEHDLIQAKAAVVMQNQMLIKQSEKITSYNNVASLYNKSVQDGYSSIIPNSDKCEDNLSSINEIFTRRGYNSYGKKD